MPEISDGLKVLAIELAVKTAPLSNAMAWAQIMEDLAAQHELSPKVQHLVRQHVWELRKHIRRAPDKRV